MRKDSDVVVVGGGIAGGAMATVLSRAGLDVVLLERQSAYRDRVRGEFMVPWGVAEARRLGLLQVLIGAGAHWLTRGVPYDENVALEEAEASSSSLAELLPNVPGALSFFQPSVCEALRLAALTAGAKVRTGVRSVAVTGGQRPQVVYDVGDESASVRCRLVIGADGRMSQVRRQANIRLERALAEHVITGMLVADVKDFPEDVSIAGGVDGDLTFFVFPQGSGRVRLYLGHALSAGDRFKGPGGAAAFLRSFRLRSLRGSDALAAATVAGPCATLESDDTWTRVPFTDGVVLIGDAAGYNNPLIGQGLSLAMRDVRVLSDVLLSGCDWSPCALQTYAEERTERMRRVRIVAATVASVHARYTFDARERRRRFYERMATDPDLAAGVAVIVAGPETAATEAFDKLEIAKTSTLD